MVRSFISQGRIVKGFGTFPTVQGPRAARTMRQQEQTRTNARVGEHVHGSSTNDMRKRPTDRRDDAMERRSISPTPLCTVDSAAVEGRTLRDPISNRERRESDKEVSGKSNAYRISHSNYHCVATPFTTRNCLLTCLLLSCLVKESCLD